MTQPEPRSPWPFRYFYAGSPLSARDREKRKAAILHAAMESLKAHGATSSDAKLLRAAQDELLGREVCKLDRITDKSIGLLQFLALEAAVLSLATPVLVTDHPWLLLPLAAASLLLLWNLLLVSHREPLFYARIDWYIESTMKLAGWRGLRMTLALFLSIVSGGAAIYYGCTASQHPATPAPSSSHFANAAAGKTYAGRADHIGHGPLPVAGPERR